jgi:cob(I)alamin adenosyltransferase
MKLYTKRGDDGGTDLFAGGRTTKTDPRIHAIGEVDESNAALGLAISACDPGDIKDILLQVQPRLFDLGTDMATPAPGSAPERSPESGPGPVKPRRITQQHIDNLEHHIDTVCEQLPAMKHFILPGGSELAARLHLARTVCRRAERACVALNEADPATAHAVIYLNRLSDLLFALARLANQQAGVEDMPWTG